ncbi:MAG: NAD(P)-dependent oxidoreductase [candidate division KSB1 bacterium]|nr:NAD(P)-dependent oxidoreductase [candidate division KSB1 bacterium]
MSLNLIKAGYNLVVWNRTAEKMNPLTDAGAQAASSPREVAEQSDIIITIVSDTPDVEQVILGKAGVIHGIRPKHIVVDMSTISPIVTRRISDELEKHDAAMLDAPVSGGDTGARAATLAIMAGGPKEAFQKCLPVFKAMGKTITHVGESSMGQTVKLCNQILVSVTNMAVCEAVSLARKAGLDPQTMISATEHGAAGSWQLSNLGPQMTKRDYRPGFMIDLQQKDLRLALELCRELKQPTPALGLVHQLFTGCQSNGEGREGTQALIKSLERLAGDEPGT